MPCQLPTDCLNEIFEWLEDDLFTLHSCLLVNRFWCEVSVRILWRNIWDFNQQKDYALMSYPSKLSAERFTSLRTFRILSILIACLPKGSINLLHKNKIYIATPTPKPPLFDYISFCKVLSFGEIDLMIRNQPTIAKRILKQEILKMFMKRISSLQKLDYYLNTYDDNFHNNNNMAFIHFPGTKDHLMNLSELSCSSNVHSEFFYQLSLICHKIQSLAIEFRETKNVNDFGLTSLISSQNNLKHLSLIETFNRRYVVKTSPSLINKVTKLHLKNCWSPSFITKFKNLQELFLLYDNAKPIENFGELQYVTYNQLQNLKFEYGKPRIEIFTRFLENNGKNLKEFRIYGCNDSLSLVVAEFCPNLILLHSLQIKEIKTLKIVFNSFQQLKRIKIYCGDGFLEVNEMFGVIAKYSPESFNELELKEIGRPKLSSGLSSESLESFFIDWKNRTPQRSISFTIESNFKNDMRSIELIKKYKTLGIITKTNIKFTNLTL